MLLHKDKKNSEEEGVKSLRDGGAYFAPKLK